MNEDANLQLSLQRQQRRQQVREEDALLEDKLRRSVDIIEQQKRKPLSEVPAEELLKLRKDIDHELAARRVRLDAEFARVTKERTTLHRAGVVKPRAVRKDKGTSRPQLRLHREPEPTKDLYLHGDVPEDL